MIKISIEQVTTETFSAPQSFKLSETPTDKLDATYGSNRPAMATTWETREVQQTRTRTVKLLEQELDDEGFDLKQVIMALNGIE